MIGLFSESKPLRALKRTTSLRSIKADQWELLTPFITFKELAKDDVLFEAGSSGNELYFIIDGELELFLDAKNGLDEPFYLHSRKKSETVGDFAVLNGGAHLVTAVAKKNSNIAVFPREAFELLTDIDPTLLEVVYDAAAELSHRVMLAKIYLSLFGSMTTAAMDELLEATEISHHRNGDVLFWQGDEPDGLHMVVSGRLHVLMCRSDGATVFSGEIFAPEPAGELAMLSGGLRSATVTAARESTVAFLHKEAFTTLIAERADRLMALSRVVVQRHANTTAPRKPTGDKTFVIVPLDEKLPMRRFGYQLQRAIRDLSAPLVLDSRAFDKMYGRSDAAQTRVNDPFNSSISSWLEDKENTFGRVVYIADAKSTPWTRRCLHRADRVLFVADASEKGELGGSGKPNKRAIESEVEELFANPHTRPRRELILWHPAGTESPQKTIRWLEAREVDGYHHIRYGDRKHMARLARRMIGRARGIVLSGGGARGYAHLGVHRYFEENDLHVDYVGGASMGGLLGASMAMGHSVEQVTKLAERFSNKKALFDYTLPLASILMSKKLTFFCKTVFGDHRIEDLWIPFFCVSSNLSTGREVVHRRGPLWYAIRTTVSLPGVFAPVPTNEGQLLTDGAVLNNFPVDIMREKLGWQAELIGINVGQINEMPHDYDYGTTLSGWKVLMNRVNPLRSSKVFPRLVETLLRSTDIKGIERLEMFKQQLDLLIEPDVSEISLLDFKAYASIADIGYEAARESFSGHVTAPLVDEDFDLESAVKTESFNR